jgi:hypothetical protein
VSTEETDETDDEIRDRLQGVIDRLQEIDGDADLDEVGSFRDVCLIAEQFAEDLKTRKYLLGKIAYMSGKKYGDNILQTVADRCGEKYENLKQYRRYYKGVRYVKGYPEYSVGLALCAVPEVDRNAVYEKLVDDCGREPTAAEAKAAVAQYKAEHKRERESGSSGKGLSTAKLDRIEKEVRKQIDGFLSVASKEASGIEELKRYSEGDYEADSRLYRIGKALVAAGERIEDVLRNLRVHIVVI